MGLLPNREHGRGLGAERSAAVRAELTAILKSSYFSGSKRCQDFLEFIVHQALDGNYDYLTERFLGAELFGRPINYETGTDSIVRVRANDVRRRLAQYYSEGHGGPQVVIDLVSGTYVPEFHWLEHKAAELPPAEPAQPESGTSHAAGHDGTIHTAQEIAPVVNPGLRRQWILFALLVLAVLGWSVDLWLRERALDRSASMLQYAPAMNALWSGFLDSSHGTDVVLSDASFQLLQDIGKRSFTLDDYLNRSYISRLQMQTSNPEIQSLLNLIASKNFGNASEFRLAQRILVLDPSGNRMRVYNAREYTPALVTQDNMVLIGSQYTNPWQQLFANQLDFTEGDPGVAPGILTNKSPKAGEQKTYIPTDSVGYCVVAYLPNPDRNTKVLLIEGSSSEATEAGGDFLLSEDKLGSFEKMLNADTLPYFEVLLKTSQVRGTPITATVEAYRTHPGPH